MSVFWYRARPHLFAFIDILGSVNLKIQDMHETRLDPTDFLPPVSFREVVGFPQAADDTKWNLLRFRKPASRRQPTAASAARGMMNVLMQAPGFYEPA